MTPEEYMDKYFPKVDGKYADYVVYYALASYTRLCTKELQERLDADKLNNE